MSAAATGEARLPRLLLGIRGVPAGGVTRAGRRGVGSAVTAAASAIAIAACGGGGATKTEAPQPPAANTASTQSATATPTTSPAAPEPPPPPAFPQLLPAALGTGSLTFTPVVRWHGRVAAWITRRPGLTTMTFDQHALELHLHSGSIDAGTAGWRYGPAVGGLEKRRLAAAFNGGFRLSTGAGGFASYGRAAAGLRTGLASIVTYSDGTTDIGSWMQEVPAQGKHVVSVRQNLTLLVDHGSAATNLGCLTCWGATLGGVTDPARSALGVTGDGRLVWVGGENLTVSALAGALLKAHVVRAAELDINPEWVAGYVYGHRHGRGPLAPIAVLPGQHGIPGAFLAPWSRDFFTIVAR